MIETITTEQAQRLLAAIAANVNVSGPFPDIFVDDSEGGSYEPGLSVFLDDAHLIGFELERNNG